MGFLVILMNEKAKLQEWLIFAVTEAEKALGERTGKLKLRWVYDRLAAIPEFKLVLRFISFETFSHWVDLALIEMKEMLASNKQVSTYVKGENNEQESH